MVVKLEEAQSRLRELIEQLKPGEEVVITRDERPIAVLAVPVERPQRPRTPGFLVGKLTVVADDEEHLKDFADYMP
jgi:antitoxin (DNA-binding transcriptional repressor) of toxin-antitoxin stability system